MKKFTLSLALLVPAVAGAQSTVSASSHTHASASVEARREPRDSTEYRAPSRFSAETRARLEATVASARERHRPYRALISRIAEAEAKGASDAQVMVATRRYSAQLDASFDAMVRAGRQHPSEEETVTAASAMARGYTAAQIESAVRAGASARQTVTASIESMMATSVGANASASAGTTVGRNSAGAAAIGGASAGAGSGVSAAAGAAGAATGAVGSVAGSVGAVGGVRKP